MKLGIIVYGLDRPITGIGYYTLELVKALAELDPRPDMTLLCAGHPGPLSGVVPKHEVALSNARLLPFLMTWGQFAIYQQAKKLKLDVLHDPTGAAPLALAATKKIVTIHDVIPYVYPNTSTRLDWLIYRYWLPLAVRRLDAVITDSQQSKADIAQYLPLPMEKITVIPCAANRHYRPLDIVDVQPVLTRHGIAGPYILYVGSIAARKNLPRLLEAYAQVRQWSTHWRLVIVGARQWKSSPVYETVQRLNLGEHVYFTGYVEEADLPALYNGADLFVFPSLYEGFGLPVLEALACGTPVVTSKSSSLPEVAGDAALLVDPYNVEDIAHAMRRILADQALAQDLRARGLKRAAQFSWERTARETLAVYEQVLGEKLT